MPVTVTEDLVINKSQLSLGYDSLYKKFNVAKCYKNGSTIVYIADYAVVGNNIYSGLDCTVLTTIQSKTSTTIVGANSVTYTADSSGDTSFTAIPTEAGSKTITVTDFLNKIGNQ